MKIIIAALGKNHVIGAGDKMPWWVPDEYQQFLGLIKDQTVIMGRKTYDIFSKDLPSRRNYVVSRQDLVYDRAEVVTSLEEALRRAARFPEDVFIAGGATIYAQALALGVVDKMYLSWIKGDFAGDAFFPEFDPHRWQIEQRDDHLDFEFVLYSRAD